ncbi:MAG TPA: type II secretion system protein [Candidatus Acidoferrales bacterium]
MGSLSRGKIGAELKQRAGACKLARGSEAGLTLLELIVACAILVVLATVAMPMARVTVVRHKEETLRYDLREMRDAIDHYKDDADKNLIQVQAGTEGYPPDLQTLVNGVQLANAQDKDKKVRYLREIPKDPMTGNQDWGLRSTQDDPDSKSWGGQDVFDVYSQSTGTALDGTNYSDW